MRTIKGVNVTDSQGDVYDTLKLYGPLPDVALVPVAQHVQGTHQTSSGIRSRRAELVRKGLADEVRTVRMPSGRSAGVFKAVI